MSEKKKKTKKIKKSSVTGQFVSDEYAAENPKETFTQTVEINEKEQNLDTPNQNDAPTSIPLIRQ